MTRFRGTASHAALQHGPRPLPLFLDMLRSETATSPERTATVLAGLKRYQEAPRRARRMGRVRHRRGRATLRDYGGGGENAATPPVIVIPSLINPPFVLDLMPQRSLVRWIAAQGFRTFLLDWSTPAADERGLSVAGHVEHMLLPLIARMPVPPVLIGYCLGGTMAIAAAANAPLAGLATIAAPWRFAGYGEAALADMATLWRTARPTCEALGLVPMEVLQAGFWKLDPARTIAKYETFATLADPAAAAMFVAMEDWANDGAPLTFAAGEEMFARFLAADDPGTGRWHVGGHEIDPRALPCPTIEFVSLTDRIVPHATAAGFTDRRDLGAGHVGMVVGSGGKRQLWEPLGGWLRQNAYREG